MNKGYGVVRAACYMIIIIFPLHEVFQSASTQGNIDKLSQDRI